MLEAPFELLKKFRAANPGVRGALWAMWIDTAGKTPEDVKRFEEAAMMKLRVDISSTPDQLNLPVPETEAVWEWLPGKYGKTLVALLHERHVEGHAAMLF